MSRSIILVYLFLATVCMHGQTPRSETCFESEDGIVWKGSETILHFEDIARYCAPILWFSPDEPLLLQGTNEIATIPSHLPFDTPIDKPVVYAKVSAVYAKDADRGCHVHAGDKLRSTIDLTEVNGLDLNILYYFPSEEGLGKHAHDIEGTSFQIRVERAFCNGHRTYALRVKRIIARAHGIHWFDNTLDVTSDTRFPITILIEEGKHASCTDRNGDGIYTPSYDVNIRVNDAWGCRDIISSGALFNGKFEGWMAKLRNPKHIVVPPLPSTSPHYAAFQSDERHLYERAAYEIRAFPDFELAGDDKLLRTKMKEKRPRRWPKLFSNANGDLRQWAKEEKSYRSLSVAYRIDRDPSISFGFPLLIVKNVPAPMTGGWFVNRMYLGNSDANEMNFGLLFGHQIVHMSSASRWLDSYIGFGYEFLDKDPTNMVEDHHTRFVGEFGYKIRLNITKSPLKFLKYLGTDYWGLRIGLRNTGFTSLEDTGFILELGAGVW